MRESECQTPCWLPETKRAKIMDQQLPDDVEDINQNIVRYLVAQNEIERFLKREDCT